MVYVQIYCIYKCIFLLDNTFVKPNTEFTNVNVPIITNSVENYTTILFFWFIFLCEIWEQSVFFERIKPH